MHINAFSTAIGGLYKFFRYKTAPDDETLAAWFEELNYIPDDAIPEILSSLKQLDTLPRNLPKTFKSEYQRIRGSNQQTIPMRYCPDCGGEGALHAQMYFRGRYYRTLYRCGACGNWMRWAGTDIPIARRGYLEQQGIRVERPIIQGVTC